MTGYYGTVNKRSNSVHRTAYKVMKIDLLFAGNYKPSKTSTSKKTAS
jgi:hypothetical protein